MPYQDKAKQKEAQKRWEEKNRKGKQHKIWWAYLYEDSAPENFIDLMRESGIEGLAMKHDRDTTTAGELKETHWHVVVRFSHAVQAKEAKEVLTSFGCKEASVQYRDSWTAVARYLCHLDDPNKYQYDPADIVEFGGADYLNAINRTADKYRVVSEMCDWAKNNQCYSFNKLVDFARENNMEWFMALADNSAIFMREYLKSYRYDVLAGETEENFRVEPGESSVPAGFGTLCHSPGVPNPEPRTWTARTGVDNYEAKG